MGGTPCRIKGIIYIDVAHYCMLFNRVYGEVAKRTQHFVQHDTTFFLKYLQQNTTRLHGVAKGVQHHTTSV